MKNILLYLVVLLFGISLVACSTNTQKENTGIGAVTGALVGGLAGSAIGAGTGQIVAIGVGAVAGALIGGSIGHSMDSSDTTKMYSTMNHNAPNHASTWVNTKTGARYTVVPVSGMMTINGNHHCRKFRTTMVMPNGKSDTSYGVACRQSNGTWVAVKP